MTTKHSSPESDNIIQSEVLYSSALYSGKIELEEKSTGHGKRFSGSWYKGLIVPLFYWTARHTPLLIAMLPVYFMIGLMRLLYIMPGNTLRDSIDAVCELAERQGYHYKPRHIYMLFLTNLRNVFKYYLLLYRGGIEDVQDLIEISPSDAQKIEKLRNEYGGVILNVPHNAGSAFAGLKINLTWPTLIISKNSSTIKRTKVQLAFFERMNVKVLLVRDGNPFELSRIMFSVLKKNKVVAATLDKMDNSENAIKADIFNRKVGFSPWAAKIAVKLQVPQVPVYFSSRGGIVKAIFGEPLVTDNLEKAVQHYVSFFEKCIYDDPASWSFLADKQWRRALCN
ncbi:MAG: hypothetical protein OEW99_09390 [Gammaproteobacteria bacterium]|nr:hypothetical protein [Gammaproteobacteria bacterium]MDH5661223.1 hypothetical protein [Gammaproteobacteria bacterium]